MLDFIFSDNNLFFTAPILAVLALSMIEIVLGLIGCSSIFLDSDSEIEIQPPGIFSRFFLWLQFKNIPFLVILMLFLFFYGTIGLFLQPFVEGILPLWGTRALALFLTLPALSLSGSFLGKYLFRSDSSIVSRNSFIGSEAQIVLGKAQRGSPAQGKVTDRFGKVHYIMIEPCEQNHMFVTGDIVHLIKRDEIKYYAIKK